MKNILKKIYNWAPLKKELFSFIKFFGTPSESIFQHLHFKAVFTIKIDKTHSFKINHFGELIENIIFWKGLSNGWEKDSVNLWIKLCAKSSTILDIGANNGVYALIAKAMNPNSKVYAFEPVIRVYNKLKKNVKLNNYDIEVIEKAASNFNGTASIFDTKGEHEYSVSINKNLFSSDIEVVEIKVETITLDSFIKLYNIPKIDLIKIDVETHEPEVLEGYSEYLSLHKPTILVEVLNDEVAKRLNKIVEGINYLFFNIDENGTIIQTQNIMQSNYYNYLLCNKETANYLGLI